MTTIDRTPSDGLGERRQARPVFGETRRGVEPAAAQAVEAEAANAAERAEAWRAIVAGDLL